MDYIFTEIELLGKLSNEGILDGAVEISEKMDGANFSFYREKEGDPLIFRSRRIILNEMTGYHGFYQGIQSITEADTMNPFPANKIFFGERMSKHIINYGDIAPFIGFAVFDIDAETYISDWQSYFTDRNIPVVTSTILDCPDIEILKMLVNNKSSFGTTEAIQEGIVIKNYDKQLFAKIVRTKFTEDSGRGKGYCVKKNYENKIVKRYCTPARVNKAVFRILEEDPSKILDMPLMPSLINEVSNDILKEEILTIASDCKEDFNFRIFRKYVSEECKPILQTLIIEQAVN